MNQEYNLSYFREVVHAESYTVRSLMNCTEEVIVWRLMMKTRSSDQRWKTVTRSLCGIPILSTPQDLHCAVGGELGVKACHVNTKINMERCYFCECFGSDGSSTTGPILRCWGKR